MKIMKYSPQAFVLKRENENTAVNINEFELLKIFLKSFLKAKMRF